MIRYPVVHATALLAALLFGAACSDSSGPSAHSPNDLPWLIVSPPVPSSAGDHAAVSGMTAYVSLPPGSVPEGTRAIVRDGRFGSAIAVDVIDGGFDPVAIAANIGDTLFVEISRAGSNRPVLGYQQVLVDRLPRVVRTSPPRGKKDVPLNAIVIVVFSAPIDSTTLDTLSVKLWLNTTPVAGSVRFADAAHLRAEFHPDTLLDRQTDYQLTLSQAIRDVNGKALDSAVTVPFTTGSTAPVTNLVFASVSVGYQHVCGVTTNGAAYCWGDNGAGTLGDGTTASSTTPVAVARGLTFANVSATFAHTCGVTTSGAAYCWGEWGVVGDLGGIATTPVAVFGYLFASISTAYQHNCGVTTDGSAYCWGENHYGELGVGPWDYPDPTTPFPVFGGLTFANVSAGLSHSCGVTTSGDAYCWGQNTMGELGVGTSTGPENCATGDAGGTTYACSTTPIVVNGGLTFATVSGGEAGTCGATTTGDVYCWGNNSYGLLGFSTGTAPQLCVDVAGVGSVGGSLPCSRVPYPVMSGLNILNLVSLSASAQDLGACGLTANGAAICWGQLGRSDGTVIPRAVAGGHTFAMLSAGASTVCGVTTAGVAYCWGVNFRGQLGDGTTTSSNVPVKVAGQP